SCWVFASTASYIGSLHDALPILPVADAVAALGSFAGLARRFDIIGTSLSGITVIDDFGHNPEKCRATLRTLKRHPGRVIAFFQRSEEHTSELQSRENLVCRLLLE